MGAPPRQRADTGPVACDQRFFFQSRPSLDLPFCCDRIDDRIEMLGEDQAYWPALGRIAAKCPGVVFSHSCLKSVARRSNVVAPARTTQHVKIRTAVHVAHPSRRALRALLRMRAECAASQFRCLPNHGPHPEEPAGGGRLEGWATSGHFVYGAALPDLLRRLGDHRAPDPLLLADERGRVPRAWSAGCRCRGPRSASGIPAGPARRADRR